MELRDGSIEMRIEKQKKKQVRKCLCVCVCDKETDRERENDGKGVLYTNTHLKYTEHTEQHESK